MIKVTPVSIEVKLKDPDSAYAAVRGPDTYLLESAEGGEKVARYSFIGFNPVARVTIKGKKIRFETEDPQLRDLKLTCGDPLSIMRNILAQFTVNYSGGIRFFGGFVGYFAYDLVRHYVKLDENVDELNEPDCEFVLAKNNIIFDHAAKKVILTQNEFGEFDEAATKRGLEEIAKNIKPSKLNGNKRQRLKVSSNMAQKQFEKMVRKAVRYIKAGDIIQTVVSQRFETDFDGDSFEVFRNLKKINPSPYMYHFDLGERKIVGSSPEMLARVEGRKVLTYPIAGTRPRGSNKTEDA